MKHATVHLLGGNIDNLGDELMLRTVINRLKQPGRRFVHGRTASNIALFASLGVQQLIEPSARRFSFYNAIGRPMLRRYRHQMGLVDEADVDCVVDFRGYYLGDVWGAQTAEHTAANFGRWQKQGKTIVSLPQAYGPFTSETIKRSARTIFSLSNLSYVRDEMSQAHLHAAGVPEARTAIAPDITIAEANGLAAAQELPDAYFCVVPNRWMTSVRAKQEDRLAYIRWLIALSEYTASKGLVPVMLLHTRKLDDHLRSEFEAAAPGFYRYANASNALEAKAVLGSAKFVVTSRYHALIGASAQGVPALCTAWSHKYVAACKDFAPGAVLVAVADDLSKTTQHIDACLDPGSRAHIIARLHDRVMAQVSDLENMWAEISAVIN